MNLPKDPVEIVPGKATLAVKSLDVRALIVSSQ
jgi:hypothetical protein